MLYKDFIISIKSLSGVKKIAVNKIIYIKHDGLYTNVMVKGQSKIIISTSNIIEIKNMISEKGFICINRNTVVNSRFLKEIVKGKKRCCRLKNGIELMVSRRKWYLLKTVIENNNKRKN